MVDSRSGSKDLIVALIEEIREVRSDMGKQTETLTSKIDTNHIQLTDKIEANQTETRNEFKDIRKELTDVQARLSEGSERFKNLQKQQEEMKTNCVAHPSALIRKIRQNEETERVKKKVPWWVVAVVSAALTVVVPPLVVKIASTIAAPAKNP
jgi:predicted nuclease with TOPRIM domain